MRFLRRAACAGVLLASAGAVAGCATVDRRAEFREFASGRYASARTSYEAYIAEGGPQQTLDHCLAGTAALADGDVPGAHRHFLESFIDLDDLNATTGEAVQAVVVADRAKRWKGDPYERCMNAYYTGVSYWLMGDPDNATACFRTGLLRDADSEQGAAQSDFAALWYLLGMAQRAAEHEDRGEQALARARALAPQNPYTDPAVANDANVLVVVDVGFGPRKAPAGPHGSDVQFIRRRYQAAGAEILESGVALGRTALATDVYVQAVTRGDKTMDTVNATKSVVKDAAVIGGAILADNAGNSRNAAIGAGLIVAGLLMSAEADVRHWDTLPGEIHVFATRLPAGTHTLRVEPRGADGSVVPGAARDIRVTVREGRLAFAWVRASPAALVGE